MIRDITLGQYYPEQSVIHRLDARTKILGTLLYIIEIFLVNSFAGFGLVILALGVLIGISRVPVRFIFKGLKAVVFIILLTFVLNLFMFDGTVLWHWKFLTITYEGLYRSCFMALRLILLIIGTSMLTLTTKPMELTDGLEKLLKPFKRFGLPSHEIALMMSIALRFIPTLLEAMEARCYHGGVGRTRMKKIVFSRRDGVAGVLLAVFLGIVIASRWMPLP